MENVKEVTKSVIKIVDKNGAIRYKDVDSGIFTKPNGEYTPYTENEHSGSSHQGKQEVVDLLDKIEINTNFKISDKQVFGALISLGVVTATTGGVVLYKRWRRKRSEKEIQKLRIEHNDSKG